MEFLFYLMWFQVKKKLKFDIMMNFTIYIDIAQCLF